MRSFAVLAFLATSAAVGAQPLTTDRPDFTESPLAVAPGRVQVEVGTTFEDFGDGFTQFIAPETLVRIGVLPFAEVRLGAPNYVVRDRGLPDEAGLLRGTDDPAIGLKLELPSPAGIDLAFLPSTTIPLKDDDPEVFGAERLQPSFLLIAGTDVTPTISIGTQGGIAYLEPGLDGAELAGTFVVGVSLTEQASVFAEVAATDIIDLDAPAAVLLHTGATLLLSDDLQLDAHVGAGLSDTAPDYLVGVGASARF
ncbi:MAG: transporter [Bacteroidota bacterium]